MSLLKDLTELLRAGVIDQSTADRINEYYSSRKGSSIHRLFIVFGLLGAILVGLGIILIIAHNWEDLPRILKTVFAFLPLLIGQILSGFSLFKRSENTAWREGSSTFLFFAIGATLSMVSQIYHIPGDLSTYLFSWMLLSLPLLYVLRSSMSSLLYLIGITFYACDLGYWSSTSWESYYYWGLLFLALPHYLFLYRRRPTSNFTTFHNWIVPLSVVISLGTVSADHGDLMYIAYFSLFGLLYLVGQSSNFTSQKVRSNGYLLLGSLGTVILLLFMSFNGFWDNLSSPPVFDKNLYQAPEFIATVFLTLAALAALFYRLKNSNSDSIKPLGWVFLLYLITYCIQSYIPIAVVLINIYILVIGLFIIREGAREDNFGILNYGLLIITALVVCRFLDTDLSFVVRGILFVTVGSGFFMANYLMLKNRKANEQ